MTEYLSYKEQIKMIKQWWRDYGRSIAIAIIVIGLLISFGWWYWHRFHIKKTERASQLYIQLQALTSQHESGKTNKLTNQLVKKYVKIPYGAMASLLNTKNAVAQKNYAEALKQLHWVMDNAAPPLQQIVRLRAARIYLAQNQPNQALDLLRTINDFTFNPPIENIKGHIYAAIGNKIAAEKSYQAEQNGMKAIGIENRYL